MKLEFGDNIERDNLDWIRTHIPEYEYIWAIFIGHDGHGKPLNVRGLSGKEELSRESFYQAHYTVLVSLLQLDKILKGIDCQQAGVQDSNAYLEIQTQLTAFLALVGRVRDMFKKMDNALGMGGAVYQGFQDLYQNRCSFLHGSLPAHRLDDGILQIPKLAGVEKSPIEWNDESLWSQSSHMSFDVAPEQLQQIFKELISLTRGGLSKFLEAIREMLNARDARIEIPINIENENVRYAFSGACVPYIYTPPR